MGGTRPGRGSVTATRPPEPCVFVLWESARAAEDAILADLRRRFVLADVVEVEWPGDAFARNLTRVYGDVLAPGSEKERQCGTGPFLLVVAIDPRPRYGLRRTSRGLRRVNVAAAAAKRRYRRWTGGGFRVHGSLDRAEAERDLRLMLGVGADSVVESRWDGEVRRLVADRPQWASVDDLLAAIVSATPASVVHAADGEVVVRTDDVWWAAAIAGGEPPAEAARAVELDVTIAGSLSVLRLEPASPERA